MARFEVTLTFLSSLNIGSGAQQGTLAQQGMLKDRRGWPYIPASTFKGRLRHGVEQAATALALQPAVCSTHRQMCRETPCPVCSLFGSPWIPGPLRFNELHLSAPEALLMLKERQSHPRTSQRTGVSLNRRRRVAEDQQLYSTELLWPGVEVAFSGDIIGPMRMAQAGLLLAGLKLIPALGRHKSAGLGWLHAEAVVHGDDGNVWTEAILKAALEGA